MIDLTDYHDWEFLLSSDVTDNAKDASKYRVYSDSDHVIIDKYKDIYMAATSSTQRKNLAQLKMFPELFNHWKSQGKVYEKDKLLLKAKVSLLSINILKLSFSLRNSFNG